VAELERYGREGERREVAAPPLPLPQGKKSHREAIGEEMEVRCGGG
jgi:hypothetical protein